MPHPFLFDIGNVIIAFDFGIAARRLAPFIDVSAEEALQIVNEFAVPLELGDLSPDEFIQEASSSIGYSGTPEFFRESVEDIFDLNEPMVEFIHQLKALGSHLFLLSNTNGIHVPFFEKTYPVFDLFEGRVYSHEARLMKPDPAIYAHTIRELQLEPASTIYIDDRKDNCEAGRNAGFLAIQYDRNDHASFLESVAPFL